MATWLLGYWRSYVTSGRKLTLEQRDAILRLAGESDGNGGDWTLSYQQIADTLHISERTVRRCIRRAAVAFGRLTAWQEFPDLS